MSEKHLSWEEQYKILARKERELRKAKGTTRMGQPSETSPEDHTVTEAKPAKGSGRKRVGNKSKRDNTAPKLKE